MYILQEIPHNVIQIEPHIATLRTLSSVFMACLISLNIISVMAFPRGRATLFMRMIPIYHNHFLLDTTCQPCHAKYSLKALVGVIQKKTNQVIFDDKLSLEKIPI